MVYYVVTERSAERWIRPAERMILMKLTEMLLWLFVVVVIVALVIVLRRGRGENRNYDERQLALRAEGYRRGFFVTFFLEMAVLFLLETGIIPTPCATLAVYAALLAGVLTFAVFCIVKDVFFHVGEKGSYYLVVCGIIVLVDGAAAVSRIVDGSVLENGLPTFDGCNALLLTLTFLVILIALLVRKYAGERDE